MQDAGNAPGTEVVVPPHVFHHVIEPHLLVDIQTATYLPVLLPGEDHGAFCRRRGLAGLLRCSIDLMLSESCANGPKHMLEWVTKQVCTL